MSDRGKHRLPVPFLVTFRESAVVTETVNARSMAEAIRLVKDGQGERVGFEIDETRNPTSFVATEDTSPMGGR